MRTASRWVRKKDKCLSARKGQITSSASRHEAWVCFLNPAETVPASLIAVSWIVCGEKMGMKENSKEETMRSVGQRKKEGTMKETTETQKEKKTKK
jgi:hypothetical protein